MNAGLTPTVEGARTAAFSAARAHLRAGAEPGRVRVPDRRAGGSGTAPDGAVGPRRNDGRTRRRHLPASGFVHDTRSRQPRRRRPRTKHFAVPKRSRRRDRSRPSSLRYANDNREVGSQRRPPHPAGYEGTMCSVGRKTGASCEDDSGKTRNESCEADEDLLHGVEHPLSRLVSVPLPLTTRDGVRSAQGEGRSAEGRYRLSTSRLSRHELQMLTIRTKGRAVDAPSASFPRARRG